MRTSTSRPASSQRLSHFSASSRPECDHGAEQAQQHHRRVGCTTARWIGTHQSHDFAATIGGVKTTASAKLKISACALADSKQMPVEMVAPEREKPLKADIVPCTNP